MRAASARQRFFQFIPYLETAGFDTQIQVLLGDDYLDKLAQRKRPGLRALAGSYLRRLRSLLGAPRADLAVIQYELWPYLPALLEHIVRIRHTKWVVDLDDAMSLSYRRIPGLRHKFENLLKRASAVSVGNAYLAEYARPFNSWVEIFPTTVDLTVYTPRPATKSRQEFVIGWVGSPTTAYHLTLIEAALSTLARERSIILSCIGAGTSPGLRGVPVERENWSLEREVPEIHQFDVGVMPLVDNEFSRGKCGYKLIQYMACAVPVVASPVGANCQIVEPGHTGFLAADTDEWVHSLRRLADDPDLRRQMGQAGRKKVETEYSLQAVFPRLLSFYRKLIEGA